MAARVLVVEDEPFIGLNLVDLAEALGFDVGGPAPTARSAFMSAADDPPDIAIVDVNLTDGPTGPLIASELARAFGTKVLMVTANPALVAEGVGGVMAVLAKPFDPAEVAEVLTQLSVSGAPGARTH